MDRLHTCWRPPSPSRPLEEVFLQTISSSYTHQPSTSRSIWCSRTRNSDTIPFMTFSPRRHGYVYLGLFERVLLLLTDWRRNQGSLASIPAAVPGLTERLNTPHSQLEGNSDGTWMGKKLRIGNVYVLLIGLRGSHQIGWKKAEYEEVDEIVRHWRTNIISLPCVFGIVLNVKKTRVLSIREMLEIRISASTTENYLDGRDFTQKTIRHATKCVEKYCELANKKTEQLYTVSTLCLSWKQSDNCPMYVLESSWHACTWHALVDQTLWSVNKLARAITKWTRNGTDG